MSSDIDLLKSRRDELQARLKAIHKDLGRGLEKDYEEQAIQLENLEVLQEIARVSEKELRKVELKIADIENKPA
jgi:hypothetical protein